MVQWSVNITGLTPNGVHGIHVHTRGDLSEGCKSKLGHYNPTNVKRLSIYGTTQYKNVFPRLIMFLHVKWGIWVFWRRMARAR